MDKHEKLKKEFEKIEKVMDAELIDSFDKEFEGLLERLMRKAVTAASVAIKEEEPMALLVSFNLEDGHLTTKMRVAEGRASEILSKL